MAGHEELVLDVGPVASHELERRKGVVAGEDGGGDEQARVTGAEQARELHQVVHRERVRRLQAAHPPIPRSRGQVSPTRRLRGRGAR
eukprot:8309003-Pyramimonas_sp.AAC.1